MIKIFFTIVLCFFLTQLSAQIKDYRLCDSATFQKEIEKIIFKNFNIINDAFDSVKFQEMFFVVEIGSDKTSDLQGVIYIKNKKLDINLSEFLINCFKNHNAFLCSDEFKQAFIIQPILIGITNDIKNEVIFPEFYKIKSIPSPNSEKMQQKKVLILEQINIPVTVRI